jgi:3-dehydroquinate synthase
MERQKVIISEDIKAALDGAVAECHADRLLVLVDETTHRLCWPVVSSVDCMRDAHLIVIGTGDEHKTLDTLTHVWQQMQQCGATRHSLLVSLGGGMVTDLGGFAASTFKRGMHLVNIPTTLLAMVDASVGGKTGINFGGLKNELGVFRNASSVIVDTVFLDTLDHENLLSGYAEMLKHALISDDPHMLYRLMSFPIADACDAPFLQLPTRLVAESIEVKQRVVLEDPLERGLRKTLNLGHTVGHALESLALQRRPVLHGYAVAWGLVCELYLSHVKAGFPVQRLRQVAQFVAEHYGRMDFDCRDYPELLRLMTHDKKNVAGRINFTLLSDVGRPVLDQTATTAEIEESLDFLREGN